MADAIKFIELKDAITALSRHVTHHLHNAVDQYHTNKKPEALLFAVIAFEELMKLSTYVDCYNQQKGVSVQTHKKLFDHKHKLTKIPRMISLFINDIPEEDYKSILKESNTRFSDDDQEYRNISKDTEIWREAMLGLDYMKQLILYFDWKSGHEITINIYMNHQRTKNHIERAAGYFIEYVISQLKEVRLKIKYHYDIPYEILIEPSIIIEDDDWKYVETFLSRQNTDHYVSRDIFVSFLREIRLLGNAVKKS